MIYPPPPPELAGADPAAVGPVVIRSHYADGQVERLEVLEAPPISIISVELLAQMSSKYLDPDDDQVVVLTPDVRYRLDGYVDVTERERWMVRVPAPEPAASEAHQGEPRLSPHVEQAHERHTRPAVDPSAAG